LFSEQARQIANHATFEGLTAPTTLPPFSVWLSFRTTIEIAEDFIAAVNFQ
jgi:hypothetical protein